MIHNPQLSPDKDRRQEVLAETQEKNVVLMC